MKPTACPDQDQLRRLLAGTLPDTERIEVEQHLEGCSSCQRTVEGLSGATAAWINTAMSPGSAAPPADTVSPPAASEGLGTLGIYQVVAHLDGDRGLLLKAFEPRLQRYVTIRLLPPELAADPEARQQFARTARSAASIDHENVVTIHAVDEAAPQPYLVMEFVAGTTLGERLKRPERLAWKEVLRLGQQVAAGVAAIHRAGLVHGNLGLATVLLEEGTGRVKLTGFGLGIASEPGEQVTQAARQADLTAIAGVLLALCTGQELTEGTDPKRALRSAPAWLRELILSLLAGPGKAAPTAAEIAELMRSQLIALQPLPPRARRILSPAERKRRRRIAVLLLFLLALAGFGVSEALGKTHLVAAATPLITGEAKLVVTLEDPQARVTLAGYDIDLSEPQTQEIKLRPGEYLLRVVREGEPLQERRLSLGWAGREEVVVRAQLRQPRQRPFVVRSRRGLRDREYRTLNEAVHQVRCNDIIEIHGHGPFPSPPVAIGSRPLTIRAGPGFRPVIEFAHQPGKGTFNYLASSAALVLEGVDLRISGLPKWEPFQNHIVVLVTGAPFHMAHCRVLVKGTGDCMLANETPECVVRNSELIKNKNSASAHIKALDLPNAGRIDISNSVLAGGDLGLMVSRKSLQDRDVSVRLHGNTLSTRVPLLLMHSQRELPTDADTKGPAISIDLTGNVIDSPSQFFRFLFAGYKADETAVTAVQAEAMLPRLIRWQMRDNLLPEGIGLLRCVQAWDQPLPGSRERKTLAEWNQFWGLPPTHSLQGRPAFADENLALRQAMKPEEVTAADFKLRSDSPGRGLGPGRKDLGAQVDEVGPGPAYERWKKTPDYQEWLKKTGPVP